jgi:hypothetical protein
MSYHEACIILDMRRAGADMDPAVINTALELCGDLEHVACSMAGVA